MLTQTPTSYSMRSKSKILEVVMLHKPHGFKQSHFVFVVYSNIVTVIASK